MPLRKVPLEGALTRARREVKLLLTREEADLLTPRLLACLPGPPPSATGVVSVYLDRPDRALSNRVLSHPRDCLKLRTKEYAPDLSGDAEARVVLEAKRERRGITSKRRVWLPRTRLASGEGGGRRGLAGRLFRGELQPVLAVSYDRWVYQPHAHWRVTLDREVAFHPVCRERALGREKLLAQRLEVPFARSDLAVMEVKFNEVARLPRWLMQLAETRRCAFSKFTEGLRQQAAHLRSSPPVRSGAEEGADRVHRL
ncbi:MAG TPA: VTC domain-containing protein [Myxococcaceae bacterium]|nr:VTC domain-containing protein [Myxococcaceae bacterium]